jgi:hypothetical protein
VSFTAACGAVHAKRSTRLADDSRLFIPRRPLPPEVVYRPRYSLVTKQSSQINIHEQVDVFLALFFLSPGFFNCMLFNYGRNYGNCIGRHLIEHRGIASAAYPHVALSGLYKSAVIRYSFNRSVVKKLAVVMSGSEYSKKKLV